MVDNGIPIPTVAAWLGHKDGGALLMKRYAHVLQAESKEQMKRVSFRAAPLPPSPLGHPAPAPTGEGPERGAGNKTPQIES